MKKLNLLATLAACVLVACSSSGKEDIPPVTPTPDQPTEKIPISLSLGVSRITDNSFDKGDEIGLYVVNATNGQPGTLLNTGNHVTNMRFTYSADNQWNPDTPIYWADNQTHADFYVYHPYTPSVSSVSSMPFCVKANQSAEADYKKSDFVYGQATNVAPTVSAVSISASHLMSGMQIAVKPGNGFTAETLAAADIRVSVNGLKTSANIDLASGAVTATGTEQTCTPHLSEGTYRLLVVPQTVNETQLITVTIDGKSYSLTKGFTFEQGKTHAFNVSVSKSSSGISVGVNPWEVDGEDHGGIAE